MMRTWTLFAALAVTALAAPMMRAASPELPSTTDEKLTQVLLQLQDVKSRLSTMQAAQDTQVKLMQDDIDLLRTEMARLKEDVHRLSAASTNVAASINPAAPVSPQRAISNIVVDNLYGTPATVVINNQTFRVEPFRKLNLPTAVGHFTYEVFTDDFGMVQPPTDRYLTAGHDFPITIHP